MSNMIQLIWLVPLLPLAGFIILGLGRNHLSKAITGTIGSATVLGGFIISLLCFNAVLNGKTDTVTLFNFLHVGEFSIPFAFQVDQLSALFLLIITGVGFLIHVYSTAYMKEETPDHFARYFAYLNLFVFSMLLLVLGSNFFIMFIGWEGVGLCSYLLIGYWFKNNDYTKAANKAFIMNRIGDAAFLIAMFWMIKEFGSLTYSEIFPKVPEMTMGSMVLTGITLLLLVGATGKSAQIPLYTWLPDAMAGPTPVSALIHAATMVTAGIYMIARSNIMFTMSPVTLTVVAIVGLATALLAAMIAIKQNDIKKVLAYSTVSQLGYMFLGLGVGAYVGAVFHVMTHAFFKALLFLGAGSVIHAMHHEQDMRKMGGLAGKMKITHITMLIGCIAIAGIPPFSGFFSKDEILAAAFSKNIVFWILGVLGAAMTAFYMFRLYAMTFRGNFRGTEEHEHHVHESPAAMTIPLVILAVLAVIAGFWGIPTVFAENAHKLSNFLAPIFETSSKIAEHHHPDHSTEYMLMGISVAIALAMAIYAWRRFSKRPETEEPSRLGKIMANGFYINEFYNAAIVNPIMKFSRFLNVHIEKKLIDWVVNGFGRLVQYGGRQMRWMQSGQVGNYILLMVIGMLLLLVLQFFLKK